MDQKKVGQKLIQLRGKTRRETVASAVGISVSSLAMYESGMRTPRDKVKESLADYYGKTVSDIFFS